MSRSILVLAFLVPLTACQDIADTGVSMDSRVASGSMLRADKDVALDNAYMSPLAQLAVPDAIDPLRVGFRVATDHALSASWSSPAFISVKQESTAIVRRFASIAAAGASHGLLLPTWSRTTEI